MGFPIMILGSELINSWGISNVASPYFTTLKQEAMLEV